MSVTKQTLATIKRFNEVFNQHDVEAVLRLTTEDVVFENTSGGRFEGQAAVGAVLTRAFELMSGGWFDTEEMIATDERCVVLWTYMFNQDEPERGQLRGVDIFRVRGGLVAEKFSYIKSAEFVQRLGFQIPRP